MCEYIKIMHVSETVLNEQIITSRIFGTRPLIIRINVSLFLMGPLGTNFIEIRNKL